MYEWERIDSHRSIGKILRVFERCKIEEYQIRNAIILKAMMYN